MKGRACLSHPLFPGPDEKRCETCEHGRPFNKGEKILCARKGIVEPGFCCRKYRYDPLRRVPRRAPALQEFRPEDFKL